MLYNSVKLDQLYNEIDSISLRDILDSWGFSSLTNRFHCIGHDEKVPSMDIDEERGIWHCFSCGRGGRVGKLIAYYYEINYGIKNEVEALEKYLQSETELKNKLGFSTLRQTNFTLPKNTLEHIRQDAEYKLSCHNNIEEISLNNPPKSNCKDINQILKYTIKLQNGYIHPAVIRR